MKSVNTLCKYLTWDSTFFNIRIAQVKKNYLSGTELKQCIRWCKKQKITCLYFLIDPASVKSISLAESSGFHFVDMRVILEANLNENIFRNMQLKSAMQSVRESTQKELAAIKKIAGKNHYQTRFFKDKRFPPSKSSKLYELWIEQGFENPRGIVLIAPIENRIAGYFVGQVDENHTAKIVLAGVDEEFRKKGIGTALVCAGLQWFKKKSAKKTIVVTQGTNIPAMRLYTSWGFYPREAMLWYHRWFLSGNASE